MQKITLTATAVALLGLAAVGAQATTLTFSDVGNITATGAAKASYNLNVEGAMSSGNTGQYTDFSLVDFKSAVPAVPITGASGLTFSAVDEGSGFEAAGILDFYLASNTSVGIDNPMTNGAGGTPIGGAASPLVYQTTATTNPVGVGTQLGATYLLGSLAFTPGTRGVAQTYNLSLTSAAAQSLFAQEVNAGDVRLLLSTDAAGSQMMATNFYGINSTSTAAGPITLSFTPAAGAPAPAVPESSSLALLGLGLLPVALIARRRRAAK